MANSIQNPVSQKSSSKLHISQGGAVPTVTKPDCECQVLGLTIMMLTCCHTKMYTSIDPLQGFLRKLYHGLKVRSWSWNIITKSQLIPLSNATQGDLSFMNCVLLHRIYSMKFGRQTCWAWASTSKRNTNVRRTKATPFAAVGKEGVHLSAVTKNEAWPWRLQNRKSHWKGCIWRSKYPCVVGMCSQIGQYLFVWDDRSAWFRKPTRGRYTPWRHWRRKRC